MSTLAEIEAAADALSKEEKEKLLRHLTLSLRKKQTALEHGHRYQSVEEALAASGADKEPRRGLTPEEVQAWLEQSRGISVSGMTTDEHMALMRGEE